MANRSNLEELRHQKNCSHMVPFHIDLTPTLSDLAPNPHTRIQEDHTQGPQSLQDTGQREAMEWPQGGKNSEDRRSTQEPKKARS